MKTKAEEFMEEVTSKVAELKRLKQEWEQYTAMAQQAKEKYEDYRINVVVPTMASAGCTSLTLPDGTKAYVDMEIHCSPNKNEADRKIIYDWLRSVGGEHLINDKLIVEQHPGEDEESYKLRVERAKKTLEYNEVGYNEDIGFNTQRLKSFITKRLGLDGSPAMFQESDIPPCVHYTIISTVNLK